MTNANAQERKRRVLVVCLTYGEPEENRWKPQFDYSLSILNRLTRRVAPIPRFVTPLLAARRALIRAKTFEEKGWNSPLERISEEQAQVVRELLAEREPGTEFDVRVVHEFRDPLLPEVLRTLEHDPPDDFLLLPLYIAESDFTTGISRTDLETYHRSKRGANPFPRPKYIVGFGFDERFAGAMADFIVRQCEKNGWTAEQMRASALILGAHGTVVTLPPGMNSGAQETGNLFRLIRRELKDRFGWVRIGWLNHELGGMWTCPSVETAAEETHKRGLKRVVYFPFGFIGDNGESMLEGPEQLAVVEWEALLHLPCPNDDREVLGVVAEMTLERLRGDGEEWNAVGRGNPAYERPEMPADRGEPGPLKANAPTLAALACAFWAAIGVWLTWRGLEAAFGAATPFAVGLALGFGAFIGWYKGTRVLGKLALKNLKRLRGLPQPSPLHHMFSRASWIVILFFTCVGISLRFVPMSLGVRGAILTGVGSAMLVGAAYYVRHFRLARPIEARLGEPLKSS